MKYELTAGGINTAHLPTFVSPEYLTNSWRIMCFSSPFYIDFPKNRYLGKAGDCIIEYGIYNSHGSISDTGPGFINSWLHLKSDHMKKILSEYHLPIMKIFHVRNIESINSLLEKFFAEAASEKPFASQRADLFLELFLSELAREKELYEKKPALENDRIRNVSRIRAQMLEHFSEDHSVQMLAQSVHLSAERFAVIYKKTYGISPIRELIRKRISVAKELLLTTNLTIAEIGALCGYQDANYFSRIFTSEVQMSPSNFRKHCNELF